jgi:DNA-binding CsgD family transcriptional regulator
MDNNRQLPEFVVSVDEEDRFAPWCILNGAEIFINDMDAEYSRYVKQIPYPKVGSHPNAAIYVPLRMNDKVAGLITVRTIHKHVYHQHHLYILKTLGNFVMKSLALARERARPTVKSEAAQKNWHWCDENLLSQKSKKVLALLTGREREVLFLMVTGLSNKAIAEKLFVSSGTIKTNTLNLYNKMEVGNRTSAIMKAIELSWFV